ncbi:hypothetical protein FHS85_002276 [Rhodoligotrophos appendicifer]|uniref:hypothetical protein n=1 Tax=Rhodoligotrophos appendicifer TaxID=987056 RepID=UPI001FE87952|nr:hypothetical protein [Rhodoligotrophos appendicifer]
MKIIKTAAIISLFLLSLSPAQAANPSPPTEGLPPYLQSLAGTPTPPKGAVANADVLALNTAMFELYGNAAQIFTRNILAKHPVILAMFSGAGGRLTLYRPGMEPIEAPSVPIVYQLLKSVGHSTMALAEIVGPYVNNPNDPSWIAPMMAFRTRMQSALDSLGETDMPDAWRENNRIILQGNIDFMDECLKAGSISFANLDSFAKKIAPHLAQDVEWAAHTQVAHWMDVMANWKQMLGADWDKTYAASNTIYVARQNNVLFSVLAQFFGPEAINDRLMLIETISFTTTKEDMLESLTRIIADRSVGELFFGNYHLMDYELMGGDARDAIEAETKKRGMATFLPPLVPFGSHQWPALITPGDGPGTIKQLQ